MNYEDKTFVISTHRDLTMWLKKRIEAVGGKVIDYVTSYTSFIVEPRSGVIRRDERTCANCQKINRDASEYDIPYYPLEMMAGELIDTTFNPTWVCNTPEVLENRKSVQVVISKDAGYTLPYKVLIEDANSLDLVAKSRYRQGIEYVIVPKSITETNTEWMAHILKKANPSNLYLIREDIFNKLAHQNSATGYVSFKKKESVKKSEYSEHDTEIRKAILDKMKQTMKRADDKFPEEYVIVDTEHKIFEERPFERLITEVGILHIKDSEIVEKFDACVKSRDVDQRCQAKFQDDNTTPYMTIREMKKPVLNMIGDLPVVGHNIRMDMTLLGHAFSVPFKNKFIDTFELSKKWIKSTGYQLDQLAEHLNLKTVEHRALGDCDTTFQLYNHIRTCAFA